MSIMVISWAWCFSYVAVWGLFADLEKFWQLCGVLFELKDQSDWRALSIQSRHLETFQAQRYCLQISSQWSFFESNSLQLVHWPIITVVSDSVTTTKSELEPLWAELAFMALLSQPSVIEHITLQPKPRAIFIAVPFPCHSGPWLRVFWRGILWQR